METSSVNQARVFLWMIVCGAVCTLVFDIFRGIRRCKTAGSGIIALQDLIFWAIEVCLVYMVAFKLNYAGIRAFEIIALIIGALLYSMIFSNFVVSFVCKVTTRVAAVALWISKPIARLWKKTTTPALKAYKQSLKYLIRMYNAKKSWLKKIIKSKKTSATQQ